MDKLKSPRQCVDPVAIKAFLRQSRRISDDNVRNELGQQSCENVVKNLFGQWRARDSVLNYCAGLTGEQVAPTEFSAADRPDDDKIAYLSDHSRDEVQFRPTEHDPRVDSYAARLESSGTKPETPAAEILDRITSWLQAEQVTEEIVRSGTKEELARRCLGVTSAQDVYDSMYASYLQKSALPKSSK